MDLATHPYRPQIRLLLTTALILFVFTVVIGILNGTDIVDFDRKVLLAHVHVGTLAWITLSVFASTLWLFADRPLDGWLGSWARVGAPVAAGHDPGLRPGLPRHHRLDPPRARRRWPRRSSSAGSPGP